jgi:hypothetical protein
MPDSRPDPELAPRSTFGDQRDDYDDEFGRGRSPLAVARRRLLVLGITHIVIGVVGGIWTLLVGAVCVAEHLNGDGEVEEFVLVEAALLVALVVLAMVIAGGDAMVRLRRRWLAMSAAYIVAALSLPLFLCGVWALLLLSRPDIRQEFARLPVQSQNDH